MIVKKYRNKTATVVVILALLLLPAMLHAQDATYEKAVDAYLKRDFKTAAKILREYVKKKPDPYAYYLLGYSLYEQKKHAEAAEYFEQAYVLDPDISTGFPRRD